MIEQANNTKDLFISFAEKLSDIAQVDQQPTLDGRNMFMVLSPKMQKKKK
jgi:translation initiation factor IF-3